MEGVAASFDSSRQDFPSELRNPLPRKVVLGDAPGLAEKQMDMFGHENVSEQVKLMPLPDAFENVKEDSARTIANQVRQATITTEREEVVMAFSLVSLEMERHLRMIARRSVFPLMRKKRA